MKNDAALLALDVGGTLIKSAIVTPERATVHRQATFDDEHPWNIERLIEVAANLIDDANKQGFEAGALCVAVPGNVDEYHGVVQYSANLPWHDVPVAHTLTQHLPTDVIVRHDVRAAAYGEGLLGAARGDDGVLYVSIGTGIAAAGVQSGIVVPDHSGAGEIGQIRIRRGPGAGERLEAFASAEAIARRYVIARETSTSATTARDVHARLADDDIAQRVWNEAIDALGDALAWASIIFNPARIVIGGGLANAGDDLLEPLTRACTEHFADRPIPMLDLARFGANAGWVGASLMAAKHMGRDVNEFEGAITKAALSAP